MQFDIIYVQNSNFWAYFSRNFEIHRTEKGGRGDNVAIFFTGYKSMEKKFGK